MRYVTKLVAVDNDDCMFIYERCFRSWFGSVNSASEKVFKIRSLSARKSQIFAKDKI